jgi:hypothetical protein
MLANPLVKFVGTLLFAFMVLTGYGLNPEIANAASTKKELAKLEAKYAKDLALPHYNPRSDSEHPLYDKDYNPKDDKKHPLKDDKKDPGAAWAQHTRGDGTPGVGGFSTNWPWGELLYDDKYPTTLEIVNNCKKTQRVAVFINVDYLELKRRSFKVRGESTLVIPMTIKTPPPPQPPLVPAGAPPAPWGWVKPPTFGPQPLGTIIPVFHQPYFATVTGNVVVWHAWNGKCGPRREVYNASGHIHFRPVDDEDQDPGPSTLATADPCAVYWRTGLRPKGHKKDCTEAMRLLAFDYLDRFVGPYKERDPKRWGWLESLDVMAMDIDQLLRFKARADAQMLGG